MDAIPKHFMCNLCKYPNKSGFFSSNYSHFYFLISCRPAVPAQFLLSELSVFVSFQSVLFWTPLPLTWRKIGWTVWTVQIYLEQCAWNQWCYSVRDFMEIFVLNQAEKIVDFCWMAVESQKWHICTDRLKSQGECNKMLRGWTILLQLRWTQLWWILNRKTKLLSISQVWEVF